MIDSVVLKTPEFQENAIHLDLYCPGGIRCPESCAHGPNTAQAEFTASAMSGDFDVIGAIGGWRSGKTTECTKLAIELAHMYPGNRVFLGRKYSVDTQGTITPILEETLPVHLIQKYPTNKDPYYLIRTGDYFRPSELWVTGLYGTNRKRIGKLLGKEFGAMIVDQAEELSLDDLLFMQGRMSRAVGHRIIVLAFNPPNEGHWLHVYFEKEKAKRPRSRLFSFPTYANKQNIPPGYIESLIEEFKDRPGWVKCYLNGTWGFAVIGDPVFHGFFDNTHVGDFKYNPGRELYRVWDFGWLHPAVGFYQESEEGGIVKLKENMGDKIVIREYAPIIIKETNKLFPGANVIEYGDYAGNQASDKDQKSTIQILKDEFQIFVRSKPSPTLDRRAELVQKYINLLLGGKPGYRVDRSCKITIDGIQGGYCKDEKGEIIKDGWFDHIMDTDGYLFWNLYSSETSGAYKRSREVKIGGPQYGFGRTGVRAA